MSFKEQLIAQLPEGGSVLALIGIPVTEALNLDLPTSKHEEWKYSSVQHLNKAVYTLNTTPPSQEHLINTGLESIKATVVRMCNGRYLDVEGLAQAGVSILPLSAADPQLLKQHLGRYVHADKDLFTGLNAAGTQDGVCIHVRRGALVEHPIVVINQINAAQSGAFTQSRVLVVVEQDAVCTLIARTTHQVFNDSFLNAVTEIAVGERAVLNYVLLQNDASARHVLENIAFHQQTDSVVTACSILTEGQWTRNDLSFFSGGTGTETNMFGLYHLKGEMHADNRTRMDHASPGCTSNELYKGILDGSASGAFNGKIKVWKDAQKTAAYQSNKNILLSETARMNTKPQLEIFADDVKCSHGATVGRVNEESMFYLQSRGIGEMQARHMLTYAFASEVLHKIPVPELSRLLEDELAGNMLCDIAI